MLRRVRMLRPLRWRDFRRVVLASVVSLLGDGMFRVAIALQVLAISDNDPLAVTAVGIVWSISQAVSLPLGGVASDRFARRSVMVVADVVRALVIGTIGVLGLMGALQLWHVLSLGAAFGFANGFFNPALRSVIPDLLPSEQLPQANALFGMARPVLLWIVGPLLGGLVIGLGGAASALLLDGVTFAVSALLLLRVKRRVTTTTTRSAPLTELREGLAYVRRTRWALAWITATGLGTLAFHGPFDVLVPTLLKAELNLTEASAGLWMALIFASGGIASLIMSTLIGQRDLPRRFMLVMYGAQIVTVAGLVIFGTMTQVWQALIGGALVFGALVLVEVIGDTTMQRFVPRPLLGRVISFDWLVSIGLAPISFALAGPLGRVAGARAVLVGAGVVGATAVLLVLLIPGTREPEQRARESEPAEPPP